MADKDPNEKKGMPPLPPGFPRPGIPQPAAPGGAGKPVPPIPGQLRPAPPQLPGGAPSFPFDSVQGRQGMPFGAGAPRAPQRDAAAEEAARMKEEKDKLEKKINDMERLLSQEKEKALLATLKNQQDEALSSKVESSLKDIQDKLRRDRHEQEVAEERMALKARIKELETKLVQERETWMQTLRGQMQERESASKDVEGHFIYRLQEMERRWLEEKAQWQRNFVQKEEEVRSLKSSAERLREVQDELRLANLDKAMMDRELSRYKDEVVRIQRDTEREKAGADRERAAAEAYLRSLPDKERELATLRSEVSMAKMREERAVSDFRAREEKLLADIGRLQKEIGAISDRKAAEKEEELQKLRAVHDAALHEKENIIAQVSGDKVRAVSELVKIKGFIARVQAVNAALDKERASLRQEKMQMAQSMAANIEETRKIKQELENYKANRQAELDELMRKHQARIEQIKEGYAGDVAKSYNEKLARAGQEAQEEKLALMKKHQDELAALAAAHRTELSRLLSVSREEHAKAARAQQEEAAGLARLHQQELAARQEEFARAFRAQQDELARARMEAQSENENKIIELRNKYESMMDEMAAAQKKRLGGEYEEQIAKLKEDRTRAEESAVKHESDALRLAEEVKNFEIVMARKQKEFMASAAEAVVSRKDLQARIAFLDSEKAEHKRRADAMEAEAGRLTASQAEMKARIDALVAEKNVEDTGLKEKFDAVAAEKTAKEAELARTVQELKLESENRARFESELLFLKQKVQQLEFQTADLNARLEAERRSLADAREAAAVDAQNAQAQIEALSAEVERYKNMESSFAQRLKWALKGKKEE